MIGALVGVKNISPEMLLKVLSFDSENLKQNKKGDKIGRQRPNQLNLSKHAVENIKQMLLLMPASRLSAHDILVNI